ncbi:MAG: beta-lactamase family protein, partial [bacterium]|nr:beta-lactamase family protein [bacterium]
HGSHLIPVRRGLIITEHPQWNYFLEPGRVWKENADAGLSRASFPFALVRKNDACTFNGVMSFLFDDASISHVWYQITQETCLYLKGNFWGMLEADYHPAPVAGADRIRRRYVREVREKVPSAPLERLAEDYPGVDVSQFGRQVERTHLTTYGVVMDGVLYTAPCRTRFGEYAYCDEMRFPSYSTAKTAYAGVTLLRLAQEYGAWVPELRIADYVEETADSAGDWSAVTLGNALDMATGNYVDPGTFADENSNLFAFYRAETYAGKMWQALRAPHQDAPGTRWVYRSTDTFVAGRAMANFLDAQEGRNLDVFNWMVREVYRPLGTGPGFHTILRTSDNDWRGLPFTYMGLFWTHDDVAKVVTFLNVDRGAVGGEQLLHPELFAAAMQEAPQSLGIDTGTSLGHYRYGFYSQEWTSGAAVAARGPFHVQYMLGYGGIIIVMMPNGSAYYYFSDHDDFAWSAAVEESMLHLPSRPPS